jgi:hypothetical protein
MIACLSTCLSSCKKEPEIIQLKDKYQIVDYEVTSDGGIISFEPACAVWLTPTKGIKNHWYPLKRFSTTEELKTIIEGILNPEEEFLNPELAGQEKLLVWLLERHLRKTKTIIVNFYLDNDANEFVGPKGKDKRLWKLLHDKEQCENYYGRVDPNIIYSNEYRDHWDKYLEKIKKERETRRKISESNQPE